MDVKMYFGVNFTFQNGNKMEKSQYKQKYFLASMSKAAYPGLDVSSSPHEISPLIKGLIFNCNINNVLG